MKPLIVFLFCLCWNFFPVVGHSGEGASQLKGYVIDSWGNGAPELEIQLPTNFEYQKHKGPDFDVHCFINPKSNESIAIYIGHNPGFKKSEDASSFQKNIGAVTSTFYTERRNNILISQAIVENFFKGYRGIGVGELLLHIMVNGNDDEFNQRAFQYLGTLKIRE